MSRDRAVTPGAYVLIVDVASDASLEVGKLGRVDFPRGTYAYVGSAMGGMEGRLARHLNPERKMHWHIDHLTKAGEIRGAFTISSKQRQECHVAAALATTKGSKPQYPGFGCSDCDCSTHLFAINDAAMASLKKRYGRMMPAAELRRSSSRR